MLADLLRIITKFLETMPWIVESSTNPENCVGYFDAKNPMSDEYGDGLIEGTDYNYNSRLDQTGGSDVDIYDDNDSGDPDSGKLMRVCHNNINVNNAGGLNLSIYAKDLSDEMLYTQISHCYIDPAIGKYLLPRPLYWSKCESVANLTASNIYVTANLPRLEYPTGLDVISGKFGNAISKSDDVNISRLIFLRNYVIVDGAISLWARLVTPGFCGLKIEFNEVTDSYVKFLNFLGTFSHEIVIEGSQVDTSNTNMDGSYHHIYIIWSHWGGLSSSYTVRVFVDNVEIMNTTTTFSINSQFSLYLNCTDSYIYIDNIKLWPIGITEDPSFEYNGGTGREDAMHDIYGVSNDYKPNIDVGYYQ